MRTLRMIVLFVAVLALGVGLIYAEDDTEEMDVPTIDVHGYCSPYSCSC